MNSILKIYRSPERMDSQKSGYYNNIKTALQFAPDVRLLPFFERLQADTGFTPSVTEFSLRGLDCYGGVVSTTALTTGVIYVEQLNSQIIISYNGTTDLLGSLASFTPGLYQYYIGMNTEKFYESEPFNIDYSKFIPILGDFDPLDFNNDFYTTG